MMDFEKILELEQGWEFPKSMTPRQLNQITESYGKLRIGLVGDICLDRYFEIDPGLQEISIETNLPVHNVVQVRCQPGGAGTILNNLVALGVGAIYPAAVIGQDGEGYELRRSLEKLGGVRLDWVVESQERHTFTYSKPLLMHQNRAPEELNRLDTKNWTPTPDVLQGRLVDAVRALAKEMDALILLDQVDIPETGVVTRKVLEAVREASEANPNLLIIADSRRSLRGYPPASLKMNATELGLFFNAPGPLSVEEIRDKALSLSAEYGRHVFVTMSERGMLGAYRGAVEVVPTLPVRGEIDIVGAGDAVTANLTAAISAGASLKEALEIAQLAASVVVHQLGTTGTATAQQMLELLSGGT
ncbi:MAG: bifunctional heptose 7-phosphate kinase/heptose 1-phosphate adenyltransferase [Limisphaerales bacterium]